MTTDLSKARKNMLAEAVEKTDSRRHRTVAQCIVGNERSAQMALGHKKEVNISLNGWEGKISRESNGLGGGSFGRSQMNVNVADKGAMDLIHVKQEIGSHPTSEVKGNSHLTRSKVQRTKKRKLKHSSCVTRKLPEKYPSSKGNENDEIEEGELIEEPGYKEVASRKQTPISDNKVAHLDVAAQQSNHVTEEKMCSKDVQQINKLIVGLDSEHVLETVAKMARRKERFKDPIVSKQEPVMCLTPPVDTTLMDEVMQQRPARKRPWATVVS
ncbi:hypothetical protein J5N97_018340 [Dioscorea zingiberensis]|uniref:Uncharacterized protein n=1 Tax=Dioscorea zingiberensis TaxID=325984 RepID=A0A9D5CQD4_9LILI|nr:hypothetical protein J5N97_018340 [Dioscorea zingiberensis]